jgi:hypothetical protein
LDELIRRDTKGVYARALSGEIEHFSGISDPYEEPLSPEVIVNTDRQGPTQSVAAILDYLELAGYLTRSNALSAPRRGRHVNRLIRGAGPLTIGRAYARSRRAA